MDQRKNAIGHISLALALLAGICGCKKPTTQERILSGLGLAVTVPSGWDVENGLVPFWVEAQESEGASSPMIQINEEKHPTGLAATQNDLNNDRKVYGSGPDFATTGIVTLKVADSEAWSYSVTFLDKSQRGVTIPKRYPGPIDVLKKQTAIFVRGPNKSYRIVYSAPLSLYAKYKPTFDAWLQSVHATPLR